MTDENKMPARIYLHSFFSCGAGGKAERTLSLEPGVGPSVEYIRADIAEQMAEALEKAEQLYQIGLIRAPDNLHDEVVALRRAALFLYRKEAEI